MTTEATRTRRRRVVDASAPAPATTDSAAALEVEATSITKDLEKAWAAKVAADKAAKEYEEARTALYERMKREGITMVDLPPSGKRPGVLARETAKTANIINPVEFRKLVDEDEFMRCVTVGVTAAGQYVAKARLESITAQAKGTPYLEIRLAPKAAR